MVRVEVAVTIIALLLLGVWYTLDDLNTSVRSLKLVSGSVVNANPVVNLNTSFNVSVGGDGNLTCATCNGTDLYIDNDVYAKHYHGNGSLLTGITAVETDPLSLHLSQDNWINDTDEWIYYLSGSKQIKFNETKLQTQFFNATTGNVIRGTINSGSVNDTWQYDDIAFDIAEVTGTPGLDVRFNFTNMLEFNEIIIRYKNTDVLQQLQIQLYDFESESWENYLTIGGVPDYELINLPVYDYSEHIDEFGNVTLRFYHADSGNTNHDHLFDWIQLTQGFGTPSGQEVDTLQSVTDRGNTTTNGIVANNITGNHLRSNNNIVAIDTITGNEIESNTLLRATTGIYVGGATETGQQGIKSDGIGTYATYYANDGGLHFNIAEAPGNEGQYTFYDSGNNLKFGIDTFNDLMTINQPIICDDNLTADSIHSDTTIFSGSSTSATSFCYHNGTCLGELIHNSDTLQTVTDRGSSTTNAITITNDLTVDTNVFHVDSNDNKVGILNAAPLHDLHIGTSDGVEYNLAFGGGNNFRISALVAKGMAYRTFSGGGYGHNFTDSSGDALLYLDAGTNRAGIGITTPSQALNVIGSIEIENDTTTKSRRLLLSANPSARYAQIDAYDYSLSQNMPLKIQENGGYTAIGATLPDRALYISGDTCDTDGVFNACVSDLRLKNDVTYDNNALSILIRLKPVSYYFKTDNSTKYWGLIAQDVCLEFPNYCILKNDGNYTYRDPGLKFINAKAIIEQQEYINYLETQISILQSRGLALENSYCNRFPFDEICV